MSGIDRRRQQVSLEEQTEILGPDRLGRHHGDPGSMPTVTVKGRPARVPALGDKLDLITHVCVHGSGADGPMADRPATAPAPEVTDADLLDALRLLQDVRVQVDRLELDLLQALSDRAVPDERIAQAFPCAATDVAPRRETLRADENARRPAALTKLYGRSGLRPDAPDDQPPGR